MFYTLHTLNTLAAQPTHLEHRHLAMIAHPLCEFGLRVFHHICKVIAAAVGAMEGPVRLQQVGAEHGRWVQGAFM